MASTQRPNILVVLLDDLGIGDLGAYGGELVRTRMCNRLAETGVLCTSMYTPASTDSPARAGILTGRYGARFSVPESVRPGVQGGLPADVPTVAALLQEAGYATGFFGQWRLGSGAGQHPLDRGFDTFAGSLYGTDVTPLAWYEGRSATAPDMDLALASRWVTEAAEDFLAGLGARTPFLAVLSHLGPAFPSAPDPDYAGRSRAGRYGDVVETIDRHLERLIGEVRRLGRDDDTLVVVTSDNGPRYEGSTQSRRGRKPEVMDGGVRVPFIASWLGRTLGFVDETPRSLLDIMPTLCTLAGVQPPENVDGQDMSALLTRGVAPARGPVFLFYNQYLNAMRSGKWKLHYRYGPDSRTYMPQLFDVTVDPREAFNVAEKYPALVDELLPALLAERQEVAAEAAQRAAGGAA
ncbi:sulfatase-like hydrolase/transferase [Motilibacter aurantiacus]|uniref:sulfatase-like hydrolase/transferase n=1 Tax=Motilibacter aurantiacus TaxID=2714955 RepID=UPI00140A8D4C|nr:sulfatase-like hydrolase/transferase [Motilibacter aurantiacus]NHC46454.1 sulfatase-like hydrolase/transferase [Motilibacter aurantiacus]